MHLAKQNIKYTYKMGLDTKLDETSLEKDLGLCVDNDLSFNFHIEQSMMKANRLLGVIKRTYKYLDNQCIKLFYMALGSPHLEYENVI